MNVLAVVPVKSFDLSKGRLSHTLTPECRRALTAAMLKDVLKALKGSLIHEVLVVSQDLAVRQIAESFGFSYLFPTAAELNSSLKEAIAWSKEKNARAVLILPADVPLVSPGSIRKLVELGTKNPTVVLSPSLDGGTNALLLNPPDAISVRFGKGSFFGHVEEALIRDVNLRFCVSTELIIDIDSEDDLNRLLETKHVEAKQVFSLLKQMKIS